MITLALDASTYVGTVAVFDDRRLVAEGTAAMRGRESELLMPAVAQALETARQAVSDVQRVVCGAGPGSFTSLRIAASIAKGIATGRAIELYAAPSLALVVAGHVKGPGGGERYLARIDALRGESYIAEYEHRHGQVIPVAGSEALVSHSEVPVRAGSAKVVGPDEPDHWTPHVRGLPLIWELVLSASVNLADWEPSYGRLAEAQVKWEATHGRALKP